MNIRTTNILFLTLIFLGSLQAQVELEKVSLIGENESAYSEMLKEKPLNLLTVSGNNMDTAYAHVLQLLSDIEVASEEYGLDIKGVKIWLNVFWNPDGTIFHMAYYPKPNSKNIDYEAFTAFLKQFAEDYKIDLVSEKKFAHYGSASFPTFIFNKPVESSAHK